MTIIDMLNIWADLSLSIVEASAKLGAPRESLVLESGGGSWGQAFDVWEEEFEQRIKLTIDILIYGEGKDKGILTNDEQIAVQVTHGVLPDVFVSNRPHPKFRADDYSRALFKLKRSMIGRGFIVE